MFKRKIKNFFKSFLKNFFKSFLKNFFKYVLKRYRFFCDNDNALLCFRMVYTLNMESTVDVINSHYMNANNDSKKKYSVKLLENAAFDQKIDLMSVKDLSSISNILIYHGFFQAAWYYRLASQIKIVDSNADKKLKDIIFLEWYGIGLIDIVNCILANKIFLKIFKYEDCIESLSKCDLHNVLYLLANRSKSMYIKNQYYDVEHKLSQNYFKDKKILLIGPSVNTVKDAINYNFDCLCRIGYLGDKTVSNNVELKTNVSFYKDHKLSQWDKSYESILKNLDFFFASGFRTDRLEHVSKFDNFIYSICPGSVLHNTECNAGLEFIVNLFYHNVKHIHLTNIDLFTKKLYPHSYVTKSSYSKNYELSNWFYDDRTVCSFMSKHHNPIAQFSLYKYLWDKKILTGDTTFTNIMNGGLLCYLRTLEDTYIP